jgi:hypothetical protein
MGGAARHKIVVQVTIGEVHGQGVRIASRCLWDTETDNHASSTFQNPYLYCVAMVFAVYFEVPPRLICFRDLLLTCACSNSCSRTQHATLSSSCTKLYHPLNYGLVESFPWLLVSVLWHAPASQRGLPPCAEPIVTPMSAFLGIQWSIPTYSSKCNFTFVACVLPLCHSFRTCPLGSCSEAAR